MYNSGEGAMAAAHQIDDGVVTPPVNRLVESIEDGECSTTGQVISDRHLLVQPSQSSEAFTRFP
jgi:hypothetical protein